MIITTTHQHPIETAHATLASYDAIGVGVDGDGLRIQQELLRHLGWSLVFGRVVVLVILGVVIFGEDRKIDEMIC